MNCFTSKYFVLRLHTTTGSTCQFPTRVGIIVPGTVLLVDNVGGTNPIECDMPTKRTHFVGEKVGRCVCPSCRPSGLF